jgi:hypothetical protein
MFPSIKRNYQRPFPIQIKSFILYAMERNLKFGAYTFEAMTFILGKALKNRPSPTHNNK